jgi:hypothetical protein
MTSTVRSLLLALTMLAAACSGGNSARISPGSAGASSHGEKPSINVRLVIHRTASASGNLRRGIRPAYISPSTNSISAVDTPDGGVAQPAVVVNTTTCTTSDGTTTCTFSVAAVVGGNTLAITAYDDTNATGNLLSTGSTYINVVAGTANTASLTLGGIISMLTLSVDQPDPFTGSQLTIKLFVNAEDADYNTIVGPYTNPVTLTDTDPAGGTRHIALGRPRDPRARHARRDSRLAQDARDGQRHGTNESGDVALGCGSARSAAPHCAGKADSKCLHRELQRQVSRRVPQRTFVRVARRSS